MNLDLTSIESLVFSAVIKKGVDSAEEYSKFIDKADVVCKTPKEFVMLFGFKESEDGHEFQYFIGKTADCQDSLEHPNYRVLAIHYFEDNPISREEIASISVTAIMICSITCHMFSLFNDGIKKVYTKGLESLFSKESMDKVVSIIHGMFMSMKKDLCEFLSSLEFAENALFSNMSGFFDDIEMVKDGDKDHFIVTHNTNEKSYDIRANPQEVIIYSSALQTLRSITVYNSSGGECDLSDLFLNLLQETGIASP